MVPTKARFLAYLLALRTGNRFGREFKAAARLINGDPRDIALANLSYDLVVGALGCSTVVLPTPDGPVIARNMDWWPEGPLARASYVIRCIDGDSWRFSSAGFPGAVGIVTGLSSRGFAVILNAVTSPDPMCKTGYPVLLHLRRVMEDAADFDDALAMLSKQRLTTSALFTLVGTTNDQRVVIERAPKRHALRWGRPAKPLLTTNDYRLLDQPPAATPGTSAQTSCGRYARLCHLTSRKPAGEPVTDEELLYWLAGRPGAAGDHGPARPDPPGPRGDEPVRSAVSPQLGRHACRVSLHVGVLQLTVVEGVDRPPSRSRTVRGSLSATSGARACLA